MEQYEQLIERAIAAYGQVSAMRIEGASPGGLVLMLLEELIDCLDGQGGAIVAGQGLRRDRMRRRGVAILISLQSSLNNDAGVLSERLANIYCEVGRLIVAANAENDPERCIQAREMVDPIAGAWREIVQTA